MLPLLVGFFQSPLCACARLVSHWSDFVIERRALRFVVISETGMGGFEIGYQILGW